MFSDNTGLINLLKIIRNLFGSIISLFPPIYEDILMFILTASTFFAVIGLTIGSLSKLSKLK